MPRLRPFLHLLSKIRTECKRWYKRGRAFTLPLIGLVFAIFCGRLIGQGNFKAMGALVAVAVGTVMLVVLERNVWILIPSFSGFEGGLPGVPGGLPLSQVAILCAFSSGLILVALKGWSFKPRTGWVELLLWANLLYLGTVYVRNPVGLDFMGSERVGGRPYFNVLVSIAAYGVLSRVVPNEKVAWWLPLLTLSGTVVSTVWNAFASVLPSFVPNNDADVNGGVSRSFVLGGIGIPAILNLCAYFRPSTLVSPVFFFRFLATGMAFVAISLSGFRSGLIYAAAMLVLFSYFRRGISEVVKTCIPPAIILIVVIAGNGVFFSLPLSVQRSLSFLPAHWDDRAEADAAGSTAWRVEMWKMVLQGDVIRNPLLGDGFGLTRQDFESMADASTFSSAETQTNALIVGEFHSGPLSTVRFVGIIGLILFYGLLIAMASRAYQMLKKARANPFRPLALFIGVPIIWKPVGYTFIFGSYNYDLPAVIIMLGWLRLALNAMESHGLEAKNENVKSLPPVCAAVLPSSRRHLLVR